MIVVDTGSSDRTREIALERGARVIDHAWERRLLGGAQRGARARQGRLSSSCSTPTKRLAPGAARTLRERRSARDNDFDCGLCCRCTTRQSLDDVDPGRRAAASVAVRSYSPAICCAARTI
jgi:glycosyltransferase involved in cell wall biosynthesis